MRNGTTADDGPIRVRWLVKGLGPGGAETLLVSAARLLDTDRFRIEVDYLLPHKDHLVSALERAGVAARCLDAPRPLDPRWLRRFAQDLGRVDVVHAHSPQPAAMVRPLVRLWRRGPAMVTTEHNVWPSFAPATRVANRATQRLDHATLVVSDDVRSSMTGGAAARSEVLVHGVDFTPIRDASTTRAATRRDLGVAHDQTLIVTVANLRADKAYPDLLRAAQIVLAQRDDVVFVAVGQGPLEVDLHRLHDELDLGDGFRFLGYQPDAFRITAAADVFTMASHHEGYPVALMEAMAAGVPTVVTDVGGMAHAVRDGVEGRKVPAGQPDALAAALVSVVADATERQKMGRAALERSGLFDMTRAVARLEDLYSELASRRRHDR